MKRYPAWWALALGLAGCYSASFIRIDLQYIDRLAATLPEVFVERRPERQFRTVGYIRVEADPIISESTIRKVAAEKGQKVGCQVLIDRRLASSAMFRNLRRTLGTTVLVAHDDTGGGGKEPSSSSGQMTASGRTSSGWQRREFICGIFEDPRPSVTR